MKRSVPLVLSLVLLAAAVWIFNTGVPDLHKAKDASPTQGTDAGLRVYIDPVTGEFVDAPIQPDAEVPAVAEGLNTSTEGLTLEDSPVSGKMVNLQGRFQHQYTARIDADSMPTAACDLPKSTRNEDSDSEEE